MIRSLLVALAALVAMSPQAPPASEPPRPLSVLFLGDRGHHLPANRAAQLTPVMAGRGIDITYTEDVGDLNPTTLAKYDALVVYANIDAIAPDQAKALLDYVANGRGFVPLHCASYCFRNNPEVVALIGAQFQRHGMGEFDTKVVDAADPIMKGLEPFHTWDETYVHTKHNTKDRHVLQVRADGQGEEPWTWTRTHGKGRVFYTAYGHDERTWDQPGFQDLVERGIRWAADKTTVYDSRPRVAAGLKPFSYEESDKIPQYVPGTRWGTQAEPVRRMQRPLDPAESVKHMALPAGFEARLFAAEPEIAKPIALAWDHRGRLWIAETTDYPNEKQPKGQGHDRIKICEDTDGDGRADKYTVFADGLSIPTSLTFAGGGLVVHSAPETILLKDTDGDDKADSRTVLLNGWSVYDTHAGPSNLRYGFDNWVYGIVGYAPFRGTVGGESHDFRQGFYRFKPDGSKLEFLRSTSNNSWGVGFSEEGLLFGSTANGCPSVFVPIPNRAYESVRGWSPTVLKPISSSNKMWPVTDKVRQVDYFGGFTAGAGHALYTARTYPKQYWNRTAFVAEPTGHLLAAFTLHPKGSDFVSHNAWNLAASDDEWTSPIAGDVGPDGNVWMIDWYNFIVQHNPTPEGFKNGKGNAYVTPLRDKTHGRIYRIVAKDGKPSVQPKLDPNDPAGLVAALKNDNMLWRMHAQRLLVERGKADVAPALLTLVRDPSVDAIGLNPAAIHALWTLHGLGAFDGKNDEAVATAVAALGHASAGVRRNAVQVLPRGDDTAKAIRAAHLLIDPDPQVRLAGFLAFAGLPASDEAGIEIGVALSLDSNDRDPWLADAATAAGAAHALPFLHAIATFGRVPNRQTLAIADRVAEHTARGGKPGDMNTLFASLARAEPKAAEAIIGGVFRGWAKDKTVKLEPAAEKALVGLLPRVSAEARGQLASLGNRWGSEAFAKHSAEIATALLALARDESKPEPARVDAARQLVEFRTRDAATAKDLLALITPKSSPALATGLINAVAKSEAPEAGAAIVQAMPSLTPVVRPLALRTMLGRADWTKALMAAIDDGSIRLDELSLDQKQALSTHPDSSIASRAKDLISRGGGLPDADRQKVIEALSPIVLTGGNASKGKLVFKEQCAKCHTYGGEGGKVGPDLTGMAAHPKTELLVNILDPSRSVEGNFVQYSLLMTDGRVLNGILASESKNAVELLDAEGKSHKVLRDEIDELKASKKSLMPEGFEKQVPAQAIADVLAFLAQRGKYLPLDLRKAATVVSTKGMFFEESTGEDRLIFPDWTPKTFEGVPFQLVDPQGDRVPNAILLYSPNGNVAPRMPRSITLPCNAPVKAIHLLSGVSGWGSTGDRSRQTVTMIVRLHYADGKTEDHPLRDGVHFADYIRPIDVPGSKLAFRLRGQQLRYLSVAPDRPAPLASIELVKGPDRTAPIVMAVTVEVAE
jgi:putative membrane-bound dehydrogenase-like protein